MEIKGSRTEINLAKSFAGEAQAGLRYQFAADLATQQGYKILADEIRKIAKNEVNHAKVFYNFLLDGGERDNIAFTAGFPFNGKTLDGALLSSVKAEKDEVKIYEKYAEIAEEEGFSEIAKKFLMISDVERRHADKFAFMLTGYQEDKLYQTGKPAMWICSECGHIETAERGWDVCPLCGATQGFIELPLK